MATDAPSDEVNVDTGRRRLLKSRVLRLCVLLGVLTALLLSIRPVRGRYHLAAGQNELAQGRLIEAERHFLAARELDPDGPEASFWLARISRKTGDVDAVRRFLSDASERGYSDPERLRREWWLLLAGSGQIQQVESHLGEMLRNPGEDGAEICEAFTTGYCLNLKFGQAEVLLDAWQADYPHDIRPHLRRGQIQAGNEKWSAAAEAYRAALELEPDQREALCGLAEALAQLNQFDESEFYLRELLERDPDQIEALNGLANVERERGNYAEAVQYLRRILEIEPDHFVARLGLAKNLLADGQAEEAVRAAEQLLDQWPQDLPSLYVYAQALRAAGRVAEAEQHLETYATLEENLARLERLKHEIHQRADDPESRYELGILLLRHVGRREGVAWLKSVLFLDPNHAGAHRALAEYYLRVGEPESARRHSIHITQAENMIPQDVPEQDDAP